MSDYYNPNAPTAGDVVGGTVMLVLVVVWLGACILWIATRNKKALWIAAAPFLFSLGVFLWPLWKLFSAGMDGAVEISKKLEGK